MYVYTYIFIYAYIYIYIILMSVDNIIREILRSQLAPQFTFLRVVTSMFVHDTLQHTATHCNTLQHTATYCNTRQHSTAVGS